MIVVVPATPPVTIPVEEPTVATVVTLLDHVPPPGVELNVVVVPGQILLFPVIAVGIGLTVNVTVDITLPQNSETE